MAQATAKKLTEVKKATAPKATAPKATAPKATVTAKEKRALPPLSPEGQKQLVDLAAKATELIKQLQVSPSVTQSHAHEFRRQLNRKILELLRARRGDAKARKQQRLEARMAKIRSELDALKAESK